MRPKFELPRKSSVSPGTDANGVWFAPRNRSRLQPVIPAPILAALRENDTALRQSMYEEIQKTHTDTSPFLYMFQEVRRVAVRSNVNGLILGLTLSDDRYWEVTKD